MKEYDPIYDEMQAFKDELDADGLDWLRILADVFGYELIGEFLAWTHAQKLEGLGA